MARVRKSIVATLTLLVHSTCVHADTFSENGTITISWKGVNGLSKKSYSAPNVTSDCKKYSICNNFDNYPTDLAQWALKKLRTKYNLEKYTMERKAVVRDEEIFQLCPSKGEIIFPTTALSNLNEEWYFILNLPDYNFQGYHVNKCDNISSSCQGLSSSKSSECEQVYTDRRMFYFDLKEQFVSNKNIFKVPSCCSCAVYF
ncbi:unnamed protein product, partial [Brenthis ino]